MIDDSKLALARVLYWSMPPLLLLALAAGAWRLRAERVPLLATARRHWPGLVAAAALTALASSVCPPRVRVQFDESDLISASYSMSYSGADLVVSETSPDGAGRVLAVGNTLGRRPPLFPFLLSLLHSVRGPSTENAFAVNLGVLFLLLMLVFVVVNRALGLVCALAAQALALSAPVLALSACSAVFDPLALLLLALTALAAMSYRREPGVQRLAWLVAVGSLYSYTRYESLPLFLLLLAAALATAPRGRRRLAWRTHWPLAAVAPLVAPVALLGSVSSAVLLLLFDLPGAESFIGHGADQPFSLAALGTNCWELARAWPDPRPGTFFSGVPDLCALAALVLGAWRRRLWRAEALIPALAVGVPLLITLPWYFGHPTLPAAARLYLGIAVAGALGPVALKAALGPRVPSWSVLGLAIICLGVQAHALKRNPVAYASRTELVTHRLDQILAQYNKPVSRTLFISRFAEYLALLGYPALQPESFDRNRALYAAMHERGDLDDVVLVETAVDTLINADDTVARRLKHLPDIRWAISEPTEPSVFFWSLYGGPKER